MIKRQDFTITLEWACIMTKQQRHTLIPPPFRIIFLATITILILALDIMVRMESIILMIMETRPREIQDQVACIMIHQVVAICMIQINTTSILIHQTNHRLKILRGEVAMISLIMLVISMNLDKLTSIFRYQVSALRAYNLRNLNFCYSKDTSDSQMNFILVSKISHGGQILKMNGNSTTRTNTIRSRVIQLQTALLTLQPTQKLLITKDYMNLLIKNSKLVIKFFKKQTVIQMMSDPQDKRGMRVNFLNLFKSEIS